MTETIKTRLAVREYADDPVDNDGKRRSWRPMSVSTGRAGRPAGPGALEAVVHQGTYGGVLAR